MKFLPEWEIFVTIKEDITMENHKDAQELMEAGVDIEDLKAKHSYLTDQNNTRWKYVKSYNNPVGIEVLILESF